MSPEFRIEMAIPFAATVDAWTEEAAEEKAVGLLAEFLADHRCPPRGAVVTRMHAGERRPYLKLPLEKPYKVLISAEEARLAHRHRERTGEPIQSFVRRLIREYWDFEPTAFERERATDAHLEEEYELRTHIED